MRIENIIFDLDGTLVDSIPGIEYACRCAVASVCSHRRLANVRPFIGPPIDVMFSRLFPEIHETELEVIIKAFRNAYDKDGWRKTVLFDGVKVALERLRSLDIRNFLVTNKPEFPTRQILSFLNIRHYFLDVVCIDSITSRFPSKSDAIDYLLEKHRLVREKCFYLGDTNDDAIAAKTSGIGFVQAIYGYGSRAAKATGVNNYINSPVELIKIVERMK